MIKWTWVDTGNSIEYIKIVSYFFNLICPVSFFAFVCKNSFLDVFSTRSNYSHFDNFDDFSLFNTLYDFDDFSKYNIDNLIARPLVAWRS